MGILDDLLAGWSDVGIMHGTLYVDGHETDIPPAWVRGHAIHEMLRHGATVSVPGRYGGVVTVSVPHNAPPHNTLAIALAAHCVTAHCHVWLDGDTLKVLPATR
jgi:hypothetical protein